MRHQIGGLADFPSSKFLADPALWVPSSAPVQFRIKFFLEPSPESLVILAGEALLPYPEMQVQSALFDLIDAVHQFLRVASIYPLRPVAVAVGERFYSRAQPSFLDAMYHFVRERKFVAAPVFVGKGTRAGR